MAGSRTIVLMYHAISRADAPQRPDSREDIVYTVEASDFSRQMHHLSGSGTGILLPGERCAEAGVRGRKSRDACVMITFDDGNASDHTEALPVLSGLGLKAVFFITAGRIGDDGAVSEVMIRDMFSAGMTIGSHGLTHRFLTGLPREELIRELSVSRDKLQQITGSPVDSISVPGGRIDGRVTEAALETGYRWIFSSRASVNRSLEPGVPISRFAVRRGATDGWFAAVTSGSPPAGETIRYGILLAAKRFLGNENYEKMRKILQERRK